MDTGDQDELQVRAYHELNLHAPLRSADGSRLLTPGELVFVLLRGGASPEYVHAMARRYLPVEIR